MGIRVNSAVDFAVEFDLNTIDAISVVVHHSSTTRACSAIGESILAAAMSVTSHKDDPISGFDKVTQKLHFCRLAVDHSSSVIRLSASHI